MGGAVRGRSARQTAERFVPDCWSGVAGGVPDEILRAIGREARWSSWDGVTSKEAARAPDRVGRDRSSAGRVGGSKRRGGVVERGRAE